MNVWYVIPSCRPVKEAWPVIQQWRNLGYKVALLRQGERIPCELAIYTEQYLGYAQSINTLVKHVLAADRNAAWIVTGGDDYWPDENHYARRIGRDCLVHFDGTYGIMQPTGDRYGNGYIDTAAASPWMGRQWCERMYGGRGPLCEQYRHMFTDQELQEVAQKLGVFWQRQDITQIHDHWTRKENSICPPFLAEVTFGKTNKRDRATFLQRRAVGFPGHEPIQL